MATSNSNVKRLELVLDVFQKKFNIPKDLKDQLLAPDDLIFLSALNKIKTGDWVETIMEVDEDDSSSSSSSSAGNDDMINNNSSDDDDNDYIENFVPRPRRQSLRRSGISAGCMGILPPDYHPVKVPKADDESARIVEAISQCSIFKQLDSEQLGEVKDAMFPMTVKAGESIIQQGDDGDNFYLIDDGEVDVYIKTVQQPVKTYYTSETFGELALMYNAKRAASCIAKTDVKLWALDRNSFKGIVTFTSIRKREKYVGFLAAVQIMKTLTKDELNLIADSLHDVKFKAGDTIVEQGQVGDTFYIVRDGQAACYKRDKNNAETGEREVLRCSTGMYFGEIALLTSQLRQATVRAITDVDCLVLDRLTFQRVMGPLEDKLKRNMTLYKQMEADHFQRTG